VRIYWGLALYVSEDGHLARVSEVFSTWLLCYANYLTNTVTNTVSQQKAKHYNKV